MFCVYGDFEFGELDGDSGGVEESEVLTAAAVLAVCFKLMCANGEVAIDRLSICQMSSCGSMQ